MAGVSFAVHEGDPRFRLAMHELATSTGAAIVAGNPTSAWEIDDTGTRVLHDYNSASFISPNGEFIGRYDKIHLVPFGEYVPYRDLFFFAHHLTKQISDFSRGKERKVFTQTAIATASSSATSRSLPMRFGSLRGMAPRSS